MISWFYFSLNFILLVIIIHFLFKLWKTITYFVYFTGFGGPARTRLGPIHYECTALQLSYRPTLETYTILNNYLQILNMNYISLKYATEYFENELIWNTSSNNFLLMYFDLFLNLQSYSLNLDWKIDQIIFLNIQGHNLK